MIASGDFPMRAGRYVGRSSAEHFSAKAMTSRKREQRILEKNAIAPANVCKCKLRDAAAAVLVFLAAAAWAGLVATDFWTAASDRQINRVLAIFGFRGPC